MFDPEAVIRLTLASHEVVERLGELIEARRQAERVRLCHGDLHLRNICLFEGRPTLFDCVEFNRAIACADVLYDLEVNPNRPDAMSVAGAPGVDTAAGVVAFSDDNAEPVLAVAGVDTAEDGREALA